MDDERLRDIERRANAGGYRGQDGFQQFDADDDVLFLLAIIARLRKIVVDREAFDRAHGLPMKEDK